MTNLLEKAFAQAAQLSPEQQDAIAGWLLSELQSERKWDQAFAGSQDLLKKLGEQALAEHQAGETQPLDPDQL